MNDSVTSLLEAEGFGPRMNFEGFGSAVHLAETIASTITNRIAQAQFIADAAATLAELDYEPFEGHAERARWLADEAGQQRPTPQGSVEIWGSLLQYVMP
jgi:hypothetical protein